MATRKRRSDAASVVLDAACASTGRSKKGSIKNTKAPPHMLTGQSVQACLRREVPTDREARGHTQRRQLRRVEQSLGGTAAWKPKRNTQSTIASTLRRSARADLCGMATWAQENRSNRALESTTSTAQRAEEEESGAGQSSRPRAACEGACG